MVIVTKNQYLLASKINHITMHEHNEYNDFYTASGKRTTKVDRYHQIVIVYTPEQFNTNGGQVRSSEETRECAVIIRGDVNAAKIFTDIIRQIREQMPDQLFLDTALERMIASTDYETIDKLQKTKDDSYDDFDIGFDPKQSKKRKTNDRKSKKVRSARKTKRRSKKVF